MNNLNIKLHYYQVELVKHLSVNSKLRFNDLIIEGLESEHMNYHLKKLMEMGFVTKEKSYYVLTDLGKDYSNLLDEETDLVEKQPKVSVGLHIKRKNKKGEIEHLLLKRLRQPYFGKVGHLTGKVKFGEKVIEAAKRELFEETGLTAKKFNIEMVYRKMRTKKGEFVQDVIFFRVLVTELSGNLIEKTKYQENFWITKKQLEKRKDLDLYDDMTLNDSLEPIDLTFSENSAEAKGY